MSQPQRILIVADEEPVKLICNALEEGGFAVAAARDSRSAYDEMIGSSFDAVVIALEATEVDGIDLIRRLRESPELAAVPVLVLGEWGTGQVTLAMSQGADACEPLPLDADRLGASLSRLLNPRAL